MNPVKHALGKLRTLLRHRGRSDLAELLNDVELQYGEDDGTIASAFQRSTAELIAPIGVYERLRVLPDADRRAIIAALNEIRLVNRLTAFLTVSLDTESLSEDSDLGSLIQMQGALMVAVVSGEPRIEAVESEYESRQRLIREELDSLGLTDPNRYETLGEWFRGWFYGLESYLSARDYIDDLYRPLLGELRGGSGPVLQPTGWALVDRQISEVRRLVGKAKTEEQFQSVGLVCREVLISLAQMVYDPLSHPPTDDQKPSDTDAKRMLDAYLSVELRGKSYEVTRKYAKAAVDLANELQHRRTATFRQAALCTEATASVVSLIAIISGRRDPEAREN